MASGTLVVIETSAGTLREPALELITTAQSLPGDVTAVVIGAGVGAAAQQVAGYGVPKVLVADDHRLERYTTDGYAGVITSAIAQVEPAIVLLPGTTSGRDLGPYLAALTGGGCLADCTAVKVDGDNVIGTRPVYQGKMLTDVTLSGANIAFVVMRSGAAAPPTSGPAGAVEDMQFVLGEQRVLLKDVVEKPQGDSNLESAETVVVGGRGVGSAEGFQLIEDLANALGGSVGATRAVTDLGWRPHHEQIGQTGKAIRPKLYIGAGVSGAVQHTVGMQNSGTVVVINRDPDAPLMKFASIAVIGDLNAVLPALTEAVKAAG